MDEGDSVFFSIFPLGILISSSEKYNPCLVVIFFPEVHKTYVLLHFPGVHKHKITGLQRLGMLCGSVSSHTINENGPE